MTGVPPRLVFMANGSAHAQRGGGPGRTYQLWHEFTEVFGAGNVTVQPSDDLFPLFDGSSRLVDRGRQRAINASRNPFQLVSPERFGMRMLPAASIDRYRAMLLEAPTAVVLEDTRLASLLPVNVELSVVTALAPWSFDSVTLCLPELVAAMARLGVDKPRSEQHLVRAALTSLGNELIEGAGMVRNWRLSVLECAFVQAVGGSATYLPYYPVGETETVLRAVQADRRPTPGLFLICGGGIDQNTIALEDFFRQLRPEDVPDGSRIVVSGVNELPGGWVAHLGEQVEFVGRLPDAEFLSLLARAHAVVIPQTCGFGCMTRVADMLCAGIPTLAGSIVGAGVGQPPGITYVDPRPGAWGAALKASMRQGTEVIEASTFTEWQAAQRALVLAEIAALRDSVTAAPLPDRG